VLPAHSAEVRLPGRRPTLSHLRGSVPRSLGLRGPREDRGRQSGLSRTTAGIAPLRTGSRALSPRRVCPPCPPAGALARRTAGGTPLPRPHRAPGAIVILRAPAPRADQYHRPGPTGAHWAMWAVGNLDALGSSTARGLRRMCRRCAIGTGADMQEAGSRAGNRPLTCSVGGRYRNRTCDLFRVKEAR
jgi:hypothetical protein